MTETQFWELAEQGLSCLDIRGIQWLSSYLSTDGSRLACEFRSADTQLVRDAMRQMGTECKAIWGADIHDMGLNLTPNVMVERLFDEPVTLEFIQAIEDAGAQCLTLRNVTFVKTCFSIDRKRMLCLYNAPDAQSVRDAQREANMPVERVRACKSLSPSD